MNPLFSYLKNLFSNHAQVKSLEGLHGLEKTNALFHNLVAEKHVPGMAVILMKGGSVVLQKGYGYADMEHKIPVDPNKTLFRIASISKCITGMALGKMMEEGLVDLDASFYEYVPYYPKKQYDFTLRQLASHTAGIRGYRGKEFALNQPYSIMDSIEMFKNDDLAFEPGRGYLYNSFDFVLLSLAMQEASGIPFEAYVKQKVLDPLGMNSTFAPSNINVSSNASLPDRQSVENLARFYSKTAVCFKTAVPVNNTYKLAGGGYLSTCDDIAKMGQAILEEKLLKKETYDTLFTSQTILGKPTYYGLGFQVSHDAKGRPFIGHVGNSVGAYTNFFAYPKEEVVVSLLINCTDPKAQSRLNEAIDAVLNLQAS